ncbi:hypothetical protein [Intrasporangium flavum]|uniref:hypothetical protein n=1 Tax=Intrasporangium flavum TaxID=1428657 RepID=UPI001A97A5AD|nr:hypothetical protein [Intrasporangium flavum]
MTRTLHVATPSRVVALLAAGTFAATAACAIGAASSASATPGDPHKVWVCKYIHKPGEDEVLKGGKNPIHVDEAALTNDRGVEPQLGDAFSDGQFRSVVVGLEDEAPTTECPADADAIPGRSATGTQATATATVTPSATATTATPAEPTPTVDAAGTVVTSTGTPATPATPDAPVALDGTAVSDPQSTVALDGVPALGDAAPHTGGMGQVAEQSRTTDVLVGVGLIAAAGALAGAEALRRRRRRAAEVD